MIDVDTLIETFSIMKQYVPGKDRQEAADSLVSVLVDLLSDDDLAELAGSDPHLARSAKEYAIDDNDADSLEDETDD